MSNIIHLSDDTFQKEVIESSIPVLVDYWAEWCGPCKMIAPILDDLVSEYDGKLKIVKLNIDENPQTPSKFESKLSPLHVKVVTERQEVYLMGILNAKEADDAIEIAKSSKGVKKVIPLFEIDDNYQNTY